MQSSQVILKIQKAPTKSKNYLMMIMSTGPQAFWNLRTDKVNPCDTPLLPHQPVRAQVDHVPSFTAL